MTLAEVQREFLRLTLVEGADPGRLLAPVTRGASTRRRLQLYREASFMKAADCLRSRYPKTEALAGPQEFLLQIEPYVDAPVHVRRTWEDLLAGMPEFLRSRPRDERPDLGDLADLERARSVVSEEPGALPVGIEQLESHRDLAGVHLELIPALRLVSLEFDVFELWSALDSGAEPPAPRRSPSLVLIWRNGVRVFHSTLGAVEAQAFQRALEGAAVPEICACFLGEQNPVESAHAALHDWFAEGLVARLSCDR
jgi:hypothetical protein